jgi:hypothetical protein
MLRAVRPGLASAATGLAAATYRLRPADSSCVRSRRGLFRSVSIDPHRLSETDAHRGRAGERLSPGGADVQRAVDEADLREQTGDGVDAERERFARATWLSPRDCRAVHRRAATADLPESPVTVNAVSRNDRRYFTLTETMRTLGYRPRDDAAEVLDS